MLLLLQALRKGGGAAGWGAVPARNAWGRERGRVESQAEAVAFGERRRRWGGRGLAALVVGRSLLTISVSCHVEKKENPAGAKGGQGVEG